MSYRWERREKKKDNEKSKTKIHNKGMAQKYADTVERDIKRREEKKFKLQLDLEQNELQ
jgi:hypothetical protein